MLFGAHVWSKNLLATSEKCLCKYIDWVKQPLNKSDLTLILPSKTACCANYCPYPSPKWESTENHFPNVYSGRRAFNVAIWCIWLLFILVIIASTAEQITPPTTTWRQVHSKHCPVFGGRNRHIDCGYIIFQLKKYPVCECSFYGNKSVQRFDVSKSSHKSVQN